MTNNSFAGMALFCTVTEAGGFTAAAHRLGHSVSHVSKAIARLEARLGTRLLNRTTRTISLTESGRIYYDHARQIVRDAEAIDQRIQSVGNSPFGLLRASVAVMFADAYLNQWLPGFLQQYPDITCQIEVSDRKVNIVAEGIDVVVRAGQLQDADMIAKELFKTRLLTVAAPSYLDAHGTPDHPHDLAGHDLIDFSYRPVAGAWAYVGGGNRGISVPVSPLVKCDSAEMETALAIAGTGITRLPQLACEKEIAAGALVPILEEYEQEPIGIYIVYPSRAHLAPKVRAFVDFLDGKCRQRKRPAA
jgi:DNA-binding transcriptional LysR family regulator